MGAMVGVIQPGRLGALILVEAAVMAGRLSSPCRIVIRPACKERRQEAAAEREAPPRAAFPGFLPLFHLWPPRLPHLLRTGGLCRLGTLFAAAAASSPTPQDIRPKERDHIVEISRMNE